MLTKNENAEKYGIVSLALFGSVTHEEHNGNSDVDLLAKFKSPKDLTYLERTGTILCNAM